MITDEIQNKLEELRELLILLNNKETVGVTFFLNSNGWNTEIQDRSSDSLKNEGISMRNIKGDFIK